MAQKFSPGWYPTPNGQIGQWDGKKWTGVVQPPPPPSGDIGWHHEVGNVYRWWSGDHWSPARASADGAVDVVRSIGQAMISVTFLGGGAPEAIARLYEGLADYPPCRIEQLNTYNSMVSAGTNLVAVVSWRGPAQH